MTLTPRKLFYTDAAGAALTALSLGFVLPHFETFFRIPANVLYLLAGIAACFAVYSVCCGYFLPSNWRRYLKIIAIANLLYCMASIVLVWLYLSRISVWGLVYFTGEVIIIAVLLTCELRFAAKPSTKQGKRPTIV